MKVIEYNWWGESNEPPAHLLTKKQLAEIGLKPKNPVGVIYTRKYDLYLYDPNNPDSAVPKKKATIAQLKALAKGRETQRKKAYRHQWYKYTGRHIRPRNTAIKWAVEVLKAKDDWVILDTETSGLYNAEIVQIGICNLEGEIILDSLVKPTIAIPPEATQIHGITDEMVKDAPKFPEIYPQIIKAQQDKWVIIYNAEFDISILDYCCNLHDLERLDVGDRCTCLMEWYAEFYGEWSNYYESYKWQPLGGNHSAVGDCLAALKMLEEMADSKIVDFDKSFESAWEKHNV